MAYVRELAESDFQPYDPSVPGSAPWLQKLAADHRAWLDKVGWQNNYDEIVDEPDLLSQWETLAQCPDNFFAVLIEATFRLDARDALLHWSAGRCLLEFLEGRPEIERLIREFPAPTLLRSKFF